MKLSKFFLLAASPLVLTLGGTAALIGTDALQANSPAIAQEASNGERGGRGRGMQQMFEQLNLSDAQKQQIESIREQAKANSEQLREEIHSAREQMRALMGSNASESELRQQHQAISSLRDRASDRRFETMLQIREVLTPTQRTRLAAMEPPHRGHRGGGDRF
ncbi:MAG: Spy/CpxP family protein refolding chaperone [Cyanobacteria bacterium SBLK]|nr:Spy/CpxP family protein refolding chaperone [Cyanobacteria bacterium SBLK]